MSKVLRDIWQRHRQRYGLTALLGLLGLISLVVIGFETKWGRALRLPTPTVDGAARPAEIVSALPPFVMPPLETAFKETGERPLFSATRRPVVVNTTAAPVMKKNQFKLSGTSVSSEMSVAFLLETSTGKTVRVTKGRAINGITVDSVEENRVVLKQGEETEELSLRTAASPPVPRAPAIPPTPVGMPTPQIQPQDGQVAGSAPPVATVTVPPQAQARPPVSFVPGVGVLQPPQPAAQPSANPADAGLAQRRRRIATPPQQ